MILPGLVNFDTFKIDWRETEAGSTIVRRTHDNEKIRPKIQSRHDPFKEVSHMESGLDFVGQNDLEWLSINYRKVRLAKISESKRRLILIMFQK